VPVQLGDGISRDPSEYEVLLGGDANGPVAERDREIAEDPHLLARKVAERNGGGHHEVAALLLLANVRVEPVRVVAVHRRQHRPHLRHDTGPGHLRAGGA